MVRWLVVLALLAGCGGSAAAPSPTVEPTAEPIVITGTFTLHDEGGIRLARDEDDVVTRCEGSRGYADIKMGLGVVVTDQDGRTIGSSQLNHEGLEEVGDDNFCALSFSVTLSEAARFYTIAVGDRGELTYSHDELEATDWVVTATLGD